MFYLHSEQLAIFADNPFLGTKQLFFSKSQNKQTAWKGIGNINLFFSLPFEGEIEREKDRKTRLMCPNASTLYLYLPVSFQALC